MEKETKSSAGLSLIAGIFAALAGLWPFIRGGLFYTYGTLGGLLWLGSYFALATMFIKKSNKAIIIPLAVLTFLKIWRFGSGFFNGAYLRNSGYVSFNSIAIFF